MSLIASYPSSAMGQAAVSRMVRHDHSSPGLLEEAAMRDALAATGEVEVYYDDRFDKIYKVDAIAVSNRAPLAVGIQFTCRACPVKEESTLRAWRTTNVLPRFVYLRCHTPMRREAGPILLALVMLAATQPDSKAILFATLLLDRGGHFCLSQVEAYPLTSNPNDWRQ
jgi:hypothetical protein